MKIYFSLELRIVAIPLKDRVLIDFLPIRADAHEKAVQMYADYLLNPHINANAIYLDELTTDEILQLQTPTQAKTPPVPKPQPEEKPCPQKEPSPHRKKTPSSTTLTSTEPSRTNLDSSTLRCHPHQPNSNESETPQQ